VATSAAVAGALRVPFFGPGPLFPVATHGHLAWPVLTGSLAAGLAAGVAAVVVTWMVYGFEDLFRKLPMHWMWWPAIGAAVVGVGGLVAPRALGVGYDTIGDLLRGNVVGAVLVGLLITKALIWSIALSSGTSGGVLAPLLIIGGSLGALGADVLHAPDPGLWAMVTMAAVMGSTMNAPLTATVFVLELTHDVGALPALLVACMAADAVTVLVLRRSIMTEKVARHGHHVTREYIVSPLQRLLVGQVMDGKPPTLPAQHTVADLSLRLSGRDPLMLRHHAWLLVDERGRLTGILTRGDLLRALQTSGGDSRPLSAFGTTDLIVTYPDELLQQAVEKMAARGVGRLPVVARDDPTRLVGYLGRTGLIDAWIQRIEEEEVRETGVVADGLKLWQRRLRRILPGSRAAVAERGQGHSG
jgi:chloride channel protein, CIC family